MGGVAALAKAAGHKVTGCDQNVYPPMSTQLKSLGIKVHNGLDASQLDIDPDCVVVGNVMSRGVEVVEALLNGRRRYTSGPQWLAENVLKDRHESSVLPTSYCYGPCLLKVTLFPGQSTGRGLSV